MTIEELDSAIRADVAAQDRRTEQRQPMRAALLRLRIAEVTAVRLLPTAEADELAEAIQGVVDLIRTSGQAVGDGELISLPVIDYEELG